MSPRAAWRLVSLGYDAVFDYVDGKADWLAHGLPWQGSAKLVGARVTGDVVTCHLEQPLDAIDARLQDSGLDVAVVVNDAGVVLGKVDAGTIRDAGPGTTAGQVMQEGPTTVRPSEELDPLVERMRKAGVDHILVTYPDGRLHGVFARPAPPPPA